MFTWLELGGEFNTYSPSGGLKPLPTTVAAQAILEACIKNLEQPEMYRGQIKESAVNDPLRRIEVFKEDCCVFPGFHLFGPRQISLKFRREVCVSVGENAQKGPQISKKRMLHDVFTPLYGRLGFWALPLHSNLPPGTPALCIEPFHIILRIQMDGDGKMPDLNGAAADERSVFRLSASNEGRRRQQRLVAH